MVYTVTETNSDYIILTIIISVVMNGNSKFGSRMKWVLCWKEDTFLFPVGNRYVHFMVRRLTLHRMYFFLCPKNLDIIHISSLPSFLLLLCPSSPSPLHPRTTPAAMARKWVISFKTLNFNFSPLDIISFKDSSWFILVFAFSQVLQICTSTSTWWEWSLCLNMRH